MVIKYSDKFESIFYAVLCANITGYFLLPKSQSPGLFDDEEYIDIDKANWQQILSEHDRMFGRITWFSDNQQFYNFRDKLNYALRFWQPFKYKAITDVIRLALKFGLNYLEQNDLSEIKYLQSIIKQVKNEVFQAVGYINLMPATLNNDRFLLGEFNEECQIGELVIKNLQQKHYGYNLLLRSPKFVYFAFQEKIYYFELKQFLNNLTLAKLLSEVYERVVESAKQSKNDPNFGLDFLPRPILAFG